MNSSLTYLADEILLTQGENWKRVTGSVNTMGMEVGMLVGRLNWKKKTTKKAKYPSPKNFKQKGRKKEGDLLERMTAEYREIPQKREAKDKPRKRRSPMYSISFSEEQSDRGL